MNYTYLHARHDAVFAEIIKEGIEMRVSLSILITYSGENWLAINSFNCALCKGEGVWRLKVTPCIKYTLNKCFALADNRNKFL